MSETPTKLAPVDQPIPQWTIKVCPVCGRRSTAPGCAMHPDELPVGIRVMPVDLERFREEVGGDA